jgi:hypothetical protein
MYNAIAQCKAETRGVYTQKIRGQTAAVQTGKTRINTTGEARTLNGQLCLREQWDGTASPGKQLVPTRHEADKAQLATAG